MSEATARPTAADGPDAERLLATVETQAPRCLPGTAWLAVTLDDIVDASGPRASCGRSTPEPR
jgi:hypothetical protein